MRTHVIVSDEVVGAIDARVGQRARSRFLEEAAREKLARLDLEDAIRATAGAVDAHKHPYWSDRETTRAWVRAGRESEQAPDQP